jgi:hypothetical protein
MELVMRIGSVEDITARRFQAERAVLSHYNIAHFHNIYIPSEINPSPLRMVEPF